MSLLKRYFPIFGGPFIFTLILVACEAGCDLLQPTIMSRVIDEGIGQGRLDLVLADAGWMLLLTLVGAGFAVCRNILASRVSQDCGAAIRRDLYRSIMARRVDEAAGQNPDGLLTRLTNDITQVQTFLNGAMRIFFKAPILAIGAIIMAFILDPGLSRVLAVVVPLVIVFLVLSIGRGFPLFQKVQAGMDRLNAAFREFLSGVRVVKAFDRGRDEERRFAQAAGDLAASNTKALQAMAQVGPVVGFMVNLGVIAVLWLGFQANPQGDFHPGHLIAFVNYMTQILFALLMASTIINSLVRAQASSARIAPLLDAKPDAASDIGPVIPAVAAAAAEGSRAMAVECQNLSFQWPGSSGGSILRDLSFSVSAGEFIGVLGATGSGKTSLLNLLCGFYPASSGTLTLGGADPYEQTRQGRQPAVSLVPQRVNLFSGTILSNLLWGNPQSELSQLREAARVAGALDFIEAFPEQWDTVVGRGGVTLSGGQKQRLSLARALLRPAGLLLLDDVTSAVDSLTESRILSALRDMPNRPTLVMVAQKISSVRQADRILVLDDAGIAGFGAFDELRQSCQVLREIIRSQTGLEADHV